MDKEAMKKRIKGTLIGCAYGDAMGMPTEMMALEDIKEIYPYGIHEFHPSNEKDFLGRKLKAGEITDDTYNTMMIAQMIIDQKGKINAEKYIAHLRGWITENKEKFQYTAGPSTIRALQAIENGVPIGKAGIHGTTNGAAMKISPIGIISSYHHMEELVDHVCQICLPTHNTGIAIAGAAAVAACVSYGIQGGTDYHKLWEIAMEAAEIGAKRGNQRVSISLKKRIAAVKKLTETAEKSIVIEELQTFYGTGAATEETIPAVLALISLAEGNPIIAGSMAATVGGDTDTIGAIACAICGSMHPDFPERIVTQLEEVNHIGFGQISKGLLSYVDDTGVF